jgi:hypothetical protein
MNFSGIIFGAAKSDEWKFIEPKSDEEFSDSTHIEFHGR